MTQKQSGFPLSGEEASGKGAGFAPYHFMQSSSKDGDWNEQEGTDQSLEKMSAWMPLRLFERALGAAKEREAQNSDQGGDQFVLQSGESSDTRESASGKHETSSQSPPPGKQAEDGQEGQEGAGDTPSGESASSEPSEPELQFSAEDILEVRDLAYGEGYEEGMRDGAAKAAEAQEALKTDMLERLASSLQARTRQHQEGLDIIAASMSQILVEAIEKLLPVYLKKHGAEEILEVFQSCIGNVQDISRIAVRVHADCSDDFEQELLEIARSRDFEKLLVIERDSSLAPGDIEIDWGTGGLEHRLGQMIGHLHEAVALIEANLPYKSVRAAMPTQAEQKPEQTPEQSLDPINESGQTEESPITPESDTVAPPNLTTESNIVTGPDQATSLGDPLSSTESIQTESPEPPSPQTDLSQTDSQDTDLSAAPSPQIEEQTASTPETPVQEKLAQETPVQEALAQETPAQDPPTQETSAQEQMPQEILAQEATPAPPTQEATPTPEPPTPEPPARKKILSDEF